jgi:hypothetical protein
MTDIRPDPSNAPPHAWLDGDPYGTAGTATGDTAPRLAVMALAACTCVPAPGLDIERKRLAAIGGRWLGTCGDRNHTYGFHVPACRLPSSDYSMRGAANRPADNRYGCAIDIGMNWPAARTWLRWLIKAIADDRITGIAEVIGSYDGRNVRYWSDATGWHTDGVKYTGSGHDTWTHVAVYRSTATRDHKLLAGWTATTGPGTTTPPKPKPPTPKPPAVPPFPGRVLAYTPGRPLMSGQDVRQWQQRMKARGWNITVDGVYGPKSRDIATAFQREKRLTVDGKVGPQTWRAAWTAPVT